MESNRDLKAFVVGSSFAIFILPVLSYYLFAISKNPDTAFTFLEVPTALALILGLLNILFFYIQEVVPVKSTTGKYAFTGFVYGIILATVGIFIVDVPGELFMISSAGHTKLAIYIQAPLTYAFTFAYVLKPLNHLFGLYK